jgi:hypothetical protein
MILSFQYFNNCFKKILIIPRCVCVIICLKYVEAAEQELFFLTVVWEIFGVHVVA